MTRITKVFVLLGHKDMCNSVQEEGKSSTVGWRRGNDPYLSPQ